LFLEASTAIINNSTINKSKAESLKFTSYAASAVYVSEISQLTLGKGCLIKENQTIIGDLHNRGGTLFVQGRLDMEGGRIEGNSLLFRHRYDFSFVYGSAGLYLGSRSVFNKLSGVVAGQDSTVPNQCFSDQEIRGMVTVGTAAYF
jgi:hypothetical protein